MNRPLPFAPAPMLLSAPASLRARALGLLAILSFGASGLAQETFVNFETPHVHPLALAPGNLLLAVNTADGVLEVFDVQSGTPLRLDAIAVGVDPVSVRVRNANQAWVVNQISDSISVVDLVTRNVIATLDTADEPADVVFAGNPVRAYVSCSQANLVQVFDPQALGSAPIDVPIDAEDPRAMAVSADGSMVYVAIFESGNASTLLGGGLEGATLAFPPNVVNDGSGPHAGTNPPPNNGANFEPPLNGANPNAPKVGLIVKKDANGNWRDDTAADWTALVSGANAGASGRVVGWDLPDRDIAVIDTQSLTVSYATGMMNLVMAIGVNPGTGDVTVVGTDAINEVRFEPNLTGIFGRVQIGIASGAGMTQAVFDLNDHLDYQSASLPQADRDKSLGDPRGIVWNALGTRAYVTGMGSNNVIVLGAGGTRATSGATIEVGEGPTGVALDEGAARLYVLNKFESSISVLSTATEMEIARIHFHDASPPAIKIGRKHLYSTHLNSGLGQLACATCHVDARMDRLAWDLGDPSGDMAALAGNCPDGGCENWHPMKGPMLTQTMQDIIGKEPHHWRGDRSGLEAFAAAFVGLQGGDNEPTALDMQQFEDFLATVHFPPNPYRNFDNSLPNALALDDHTTTGRFAAAGQPLGTGDATRGLQLYTPPNFLDGGTVACVTCHTLPLGMGPNSVFNGFQHVPLPPGPDGELHHSLVSVDGSTQKTLKIPQLRNLYERTGFNATQTSNRAGFGYIHDGSVDSIERFVSEPVFGVQSDQDVADLTAFMLAFSGSDLPGGSSTNPFFPPGTASQDAHAAIGAQHTYVNGANPSAADLQFFADVVGMADAGDVALVVKGLRAGEARGYAYIGAGNFQSDRAAEVIDNLTLLGGGVVGAELTMTVVVVGTETRLGVDRDEDGFLDRDELDAGSDPADPLSTPNGPGTPFCFGDGTGTACPCGNTSPAGSGGCLNSTGVGALLGASGVSDTSNDSLLLSGSGLVAGRTALLFQGNDLQSAGLGLAFGDGLRCAGGFVVRLKVLLPDAQGGVSYPQAGDPALSVAGGASAGDTRRYQIWYRDTTGGPCASGFNLTNGYEVFWQ